MSQFRIVVGFAIVTIWIAWEIWAGQIELWYALTKGEIPQRFLHSTISHVVAALITVVIALIVVRLVKAGGLILRFGSDRISATNAEDAAAEINLAPIEQLLQTARFLSTVAATICVLLWPFTLFGIFVLIAVLGGLDKEPLPAKDIPLVVVFLFSASLILWLPYQWSRDIARGRQAPVAMISVIIGGLIASFGSWELYVTTFGDRGPGVYIYDLPRGYIDFGSRGAIGLSLLLMVGPVATIAFGLRVTADGFKFSEHLRAIARFQPGCAANVLMPPASTMSAIARAVGIHPICLWLPTASRRLMVGALFVLATLSLAGSVTYIAYIFFRGFPGEVAGILVSKCYTVAFERPQSCLRGLPGMFAYAVSGLAASVILRRLGYRLSRISLEQLSTIDQRPPVLFLRSFLDDQVALQETTAADLAPPLRDWGHS